MATLDIEIDPSNASRGAGVIAGALGGVSKAAQAAGRSGIEMGRSFGRAIEGVVQASQAVTGVNDALGGVVGSSDEAGSHFLGAFDSARLSVGALRGPINFVTSAIGVLVSKLIIDPAVDSWRELTATLGDLASITGATGADLEFLTSSARDFGAETIFSTQQSAELLKLVASARPQLLQNFSGLSDVTEQVLLLATAAGIDLPQATAAAAGSLNQFDIQSAESARIVNVLAAGAKFGSSEIASTAQALAEAGVVAANANVSFEEINAAIQLLAAGGIAGGRAGTALKNVILGLQLSTDDFNPTAHGLAGALENVSNAGLSTTDTLKLVGREGITALSILTSAGEEFGALTDRITGTDAALEQVNLRLNTLAGDQLRLDSALQAAGESFGAYFEPLERYTTQLKTAFVEALNSFLRLDDSIRSRAATQAEQALGPAPGAQPFDINEDFLQRTDFARRLDNTFLDFFDTAVQGAERVRVVSANFFTEQFANVRAYVAELRGQDAVAQDILATAQEEIQYRMQLLNVTNSLLDAERFRRDNPNAEAGTATADQRLVALNNAIEAEKELARIEQQRRETIAAGLDPLRDITSASLGEQVQAAASILENTRSDTAALAVQLERIQLLGDLGVFSPDVEENAERTQQAIAAVTARYEQAIEQQRAAEEAEVQRQQQLADRRIAILEREQAQRQAIADRLVDQFIPLEAADRRRAEATEAASTAQRQGLLTSAQYATVIAGISQRHQEETDRLNGVTAAMRTRQSVINRYLRDRAALQRYRQALVDINKANLSSVDSERAKNAALREYRAVLLSLNEPQQRLAEEQRRIAEEGARRFEQFSTDVSNALASFITGTEDSISNFFRNFAQQLLQAQIQASVVQPLLSSLVGNLGGGPGGLLGTLLGPILNQLGAPAPPAAGSPTLTLPPGNNPRVAVSSEPQPTTGGTAPVRFLSSARDDDQRPSPANPPAAGQTQAAQVTVNNYGPADSVDVRTSTGPSGEQVIDITVADSLRRQSSTGELDRTMGFYGGRRGLIPAG